MPLWKKLKPHDSLQGPTPSFPSSLSDIVSLCSTNIPQTQEIAITSGVITLSPHKNFIPVFPSAKNTLCPGGHETSSLLLQSLSRVISGYSNLPIQSSSLPENAIFFLRHESCSNILYKLWLSAHPKVWASGRSHFSPLVHKPHHWEQK